MTIHDPSLRAALKTLKLTGMLDTLDARLAQTRDGQLGHLEFLQVLCEDEIARRETAALARRVRRAKFEQQATFEDFDFTANPKLPAAMLRDLAALRWLDAGESVILYGPVGVGKTHVAQALGHYVARRGGDVRFVKCSRMLADLAGGHADRTIGQRMREYTRPLVLIIDDFAMREPTTQSDDLYDLVSDRAIAGKPLVLTSNRAPKDWYPLFPNPVVAESLLDRLINTSHQILMDGPSYRPRKRPGNRTAAANRTNRGTGPATLDSARPAHREFRDGNPWGITRRSTARVCRDACRVRHPETRGTRPERDSDHRPRDRDSFRRRNSRLAEGTRGGTFGCAVGSQENSGTYGGHRNSDRSDVPEGTVTRVCT